MALAFFLPHRQLPCFQGRSCSAGIWSPHWCGCAQWLTSSPTRPKGGRGVTWLPTERVRDLTYRLLDMFDWCLRLTISSWKNVDVIGRSFRSSNVMFIVVFELFQLPFLTCAIGHLFGVKATRLRSNEAFGLVCAGKSTRVKVWRKRGGLILTGFCMFLHDILIFKCYSDNLLLHISWGHDRCLYPISNTYSAKMVFAFSLHACWLVGYCVSPPGVFNVRWALTRCFVQLHDVTICIPFSSKLYIMYVVDGNPFFFVGSFCNCFIYWKDLNMLFWTFDCQHVEITISLAEFSWYINFLCYVPLRFGKLISIMLKRSIGQVDDDTIAGKKELASWGLWGFVRIGPWWLFSFYPGSWFMNARWSQLKYFFIFNPIPGEDSHFDEYFSDGLKPPTRIFMTLKIGYHGLSLWVRCVKMLPAPGWSTSQPVAGWCRKHQESHEQDGDWVSGVANCGLTKVLALLKSGG